MKSTIQSILFFGIILMSGSFFFSSCSTPTGTTISGEIVDAANLKLAFDRVTIGNKRSELQKIELDQQGKFSMSFPEGLEEGIYGLRIGVKRFLMVLGENDRGVHFSGNLSDFNTYTLALKGSETTAQFADLMKKYMASPEQREQYIRIIDSMKSPYAAMLAGTQICAGQEKYLPKLKELGERFAQAYPDSPDSKDFTAYVVKLESAINAQKVSEKIKVGAMAPDIDLPNPDGKNLKLSDLKGNVVLLDFWASWCAPCRKVNPIIVKAYDKYKSQGFEIYSVSLDGLSAEQKAMAVKRNILDEQLAKSKSYWEKAIKTDKLAWPNHVSDLSSWSSVPAGTYGVRGIPATFLIDRDGKIARVGVDPRINLEKQIQELL